MHYCERTQTDPHFCNPLTTPLPPSSSLLLVPVLVPVLVLVLLVLAICHARAVRAIATARVMFCCSLIKIPLLTRRMCHHRCRGAFGSNVNHFPNGTVICDKACYDTMCAQDAQDFYTVRSALKLLLASAAAAACTAAAPSEDRDNHDRRRCSACEQWGKADPRVAAIAPWNWGGCTTSNGSRFTPPHTCCMDEIGTRDQPLTRAAWIEIAGLSRWPAAAADCACYNSVGWMCWPAAAADCACYNSMGWMRVSVSASLNEYLNGNLTCFVLSSADGRELGGISEIASLGSIPMALEWMDLYAATTAVFTGSLKKRASMATCMKQKQMRLLVSVATKGAEDSGALILKFITV